LVARSWWRGRVGVGSGRSERPPEGARLRARGGAGGARGARGARVTCPAPREVLARSV